MNIKEKAGHARQLLQDETFQEVLNSIREQQTKVFLNSESSQDDLKHAHDVIRALNHIEDGFNTIFLDEALFDKKEKGTAPWKRLKL